MKQLSVRAAARRFGRLDDYWMREWSHQAVHGEDVAWMTYLERRGDRIGVFAKTEDPQALASAIGFSTESFVSFGSYFRDARLDVSGDCLVRLEEHRGCSGGGSSARRTALSGCPL